MEFLRDDVKYERGYTRIIVRHYRDNDNEEHEWGILHINGFGPGASVLAITPKNEIVLERSYRIPMKNYVIELPGGCNDIEGETPEDVARRELLEETGYTGEHFVELSRILDAPGMSDQESALFLAEAIQKTNAPVLGASEEIEILLVPLEGVMSFLQNSPSRVDAKVYAGLALLQEYRKKQVA